MDSRYVKRLGDICKNLASVDSGFGAVRFRKSMDAMSWKAELFGAASLI